MAITIQTGAHQFSHSDITKYSLFMGGLNATHDVLKQYDPLTTGYYRLFMVREPVFLKKYFEEPGGKRLSKFTAYKHILEYGNVGVSGLSSPSVDFDAIKGGYAGRSFEIPKGTDDSTNELTIKVYDFSGSIMREVTHAWVNGGVDLITGFTHFNGLIASGEVAFSQANQTAEFIYVVTDRTGMKVEYACMFANCFPKEIPTDHFNSDSPEDHNLVSFDLKFTTTKYEGYDVNEKAKALLKRYQIMTNSLEFYSGLENNGHDYLGSGKGYNPRNGMLDPLTGNTLGAGTAYQTTYRTGINNPNQNETTQSIDLSEGSILKPTPSFTDVGNRRRLA